MRRAATTVVFMGKWSAKSALLLLFCLGLLVCGAAASLRAQSTSATINGQITDPQGKIVPGVAVQAVNIDTSSVYAGKTNGSGIYVIPALPPGRYRLVVRQDGFKEINKTDILLHVQDTFEENFTLEIGSTSESITVEGGALVMNTTDGAVSTVIDRNFVGNIPLNGRSFQDLIDMTPGVVTQSPQAQSGLGLNGDFSVNGQRTESNYYIVDGVSANTGAGAGVGGTYGPGTSGTIGASTALGTTQSLLSVDALQEFRVESSTYSAEYGRSPGGQFSFVSRAGTSSLHGSLFEYLRNNALDANDWFNNYYGIAQPALRQNDFGGTVGGPIWIPGLYERKDKTFFFLSYEGLRLTQPTNANLQYVPSESLRESAPSALQPMLNAYPIPTGAEIQIACDNVTFRCPVGQPVGTVVPSGLAPFIQAYSVPSTINSISLRLDHSIGARIHTFLRAAYTPSSADLRALSVLSAQKYSLQTYTVGVDAQGSNTLNNQLRIGYSRSVDKVSNAVTSFGGNTPVNLADAMGSPGFGASDTFGLQFTGIGSTYLATQDTSNYSQQWNAKDVVSWTVGRHSLSAGIDYRRITSPYVASDPIVAAAFASPASVLSNSANGYIGRQRSLEPVYNQLALFVQDAWRVTPSLSLSFGLRWDLDPPPHSANAIKVYPLEGDPGNPSTYSLGVLGAPLYKTTWNNFAPRVGVAWNAHGSPGAQTVLRAGFGLFYDAGTSGTGSVFSDGLNASAYAYPPSIMLPVTPADLNLSFGVSPPYQQTAFAVAPNFRLPYTIEWSAAVQQAIGRQQSVTVSYVGANGRRLVQDNFIIGGPLSPDFAANGLVVYQNGLTSNYQALQVQFQRQVSRGVQALASYTWSHSIDYGSEDGNVGYQRGNSDFDVRNNFNAALTWDLPHVRGNALSRAVLNGWGSDFRIFARSGFPVTLNGNFFFDPDTGTGAYSGLDLLPGVPFYTYSPLLPGGRAINQNAFVDAPANTIGNAPRNFLRGFGETQFNLAVRRDFPIFENVRLQFRAEVFNIFNRANFGYIDPHLGDATFGQATATLANSLATLSPLYQQGGARSIQFALKLIF